MNYDAATTWLNKRSNLPTAMGSAEIGATLDASVKARSFFSAKVAEAHILDKLRDVSDRFSSGKIDRASARTELKRWLAGQGYQPNDVAGIPPDGVKSKDWERNAAITNLASTARLDLILQQNARMAAAVGQYQVGMDPDIMARWPNWRYITGPRSRDSHAALNGLVLPKTDPFWASHTPPWDFNCNCSIEDCDDEEAQKSGGVKQSIDGKVDRGGQIIGSDIPESGYTFNPAEAYGSCDISSIKDPVIRAEVHKKVVKYCAENSASTSFTISEIYKPKETKVDASGIPTKEQKIEIKNAFAKIDAAIKAGAANLPSIEISLGRLLPVHAEAIGITGEETAMFLRSPGITGKYGPEHGIKHHADSYQPDIAMKLLEQTIWNPKARIREDIQGKKRRLIFISKYKGKNVMTTMWRKGQAWELNHVDSWEPPDVYVEKKGK